MKTLKTSLFTLAVAFSMLFSINANADYISNSTVGAGGYDLVSFQDSKKPVLGNGNYLATVDNVNYLFSNKANLKAFNKNPDKYLPQYGGYCAYGAAVGKKFIGDPEVWKVVNEKLYFNLDNNVKAVWLEDLEENIVDADKKWPKIKGIPAADL